MSIVTSKNDIGFELYFFRQILRQDNASLRRQCDHTLHEIFQLPVRFPAIHSAYLILEAPRAKVSSIQSRVSREIVLEKMLDQKWNILTAVAQSRQMDGNDIQSVREVLPERSFLHHEPKIGAGCRNNPHVDFDRSIAAESIKLPFLNDAQQLDLQGSRHVADLIEEDRAAVGLFKFADPGLDGTRKGAFDVTKQLRFEQVFRNRSAVYADKLLMFSLAVEMNGPGNQLFAGTGLALDQNRTR